MSQLKFYTVVLGLALMQNAFCMDRLCYTKEKGLFSCAPVEITTDDKSFCEGKYVCQKDGAYIDAEDTPSDSDKNQACEDLGGKMVAIPKGDSCVALEAVSKDFFMNVSNECEDGCTPELVEVLSKNENNNCCQIKLKIKCKSKD